MDSVRVFNEAEFLQLLNTGKTPKWFSKEARKRIRHRTAFLNTERAVDDLVCLDFLAHAYFLRQLASVLGTHDAPRQLVTGVGFAILDDAVIQGLVEEEDGSDYSFSSTERLSQYWSAIFDGEPAPSEEDGPYLGNARHSQLSGR